MLGAGSVASGLKFWESKPKEAPVTTAANDGLAAPGGVEPVAEAIGGGAVLTRTESQTEAALFDEILTSPIYTKDQFLRLLEAEKETRGSTPEEHRMWSYPRRWKVVIWGVKLANCMNDSIDAFVEFDFGGDREECRVKDGRKEKIYATGHLKHRLRTAVTYGVSQGEMTDLQYRCKLEYRGSYVDLENEKLKVRAWSYHKYKLNHLEGLHEGPLVTYVTGPAHNQLELYKAVKGKRTLRCRVQFQLYFQEIYDFELSFYKWRVLGMQTSREIQHKMDLLRGRKESNAMEALSKRCLLMWTREKNNFRRLSSVSGATRTSNFNRTSGRRSTSRHGIFKRPVKRLRGRSEEYREGGREEDDVEDETETRIPHDALTEAELKQMELRKRCSTRVLFRLSTTSRHNDGLSLKSSILLNVMRPKWDNVGALYFRGTVQELEACEVSVDVFDLSVSKLNQSVARGVIPLKGVVDYSYLRSELSTPKWVTATAKLEGWQASLRRWRFGTIEGKISIANTPKYRQLGDIEDVSASRIYLFVHVNEVDPIVTAENRNDVDAFVQVSFDGDIRCTRVIKNKLSPIFDEALAIPLRLPDKDDISPFDLERKGRVWLDVWTALPLGNEHCGSYSFTLHDVCFDAKGHRRTPVEKRFVPFSGSGEEVRFKTPVYESKSRLQFIFGTDRASVISFSAWTMPDLLNASGLSGFDRKEDAELPQRLREDMPSLEARFKEFCETESRKLEKGTRQFYSSVKDQRFREQFLPLFLGKVVPPKRVDTLNGIFHYVRSIPFAAPRRELKFWMTPDFTLTSRIGTIIDHCLLHCSLLIGLPAQAFVCIGTLWNHAAHAWVCTFHYSAEDDTGFVRFWESTSGQVYTMKNRFFDKRTIKDVFEKPDLSKAQFTQEDRWRLFAAIARGLGQADDKNGNHEGDNKGDRNEANSTTHNATNRRLTSPQTSVVAGPAPKLPYRSLEMIFNHINLWVNCQDPNPRKVWFDLWRKELFLQFTSRNFDLQPCFITKAFGRHPLDLTPFQKEVKDQVVSEITLYRSSRNLLTRWNKDVSLETFLEKGLKLVFQMETVLEDDQQFSEAKLKEWRKALFSKVPESYRLRGCALYFNTPDPKYIADAVTKKCDFIENRERSAVFATAVYVRGLPGELVSTYVYLLTVHKVNERQKRKIMEAKLARQKKKAQKKSKEKKP